MWWGETNIFFIGARGGEETGVEMDVSWWAKQLGQTKKWKINFDFLILGIDFLDLVVTCNFL